MDEMQAAREKQREKEEAEIQSYLEERDRQRVQDDEELEALKERVRERKAEREEQDRYMEDLKRTQEERRKEEDDAKKAKSEALKRKRDEERKKKQALMSGGGIAGGGGGGGGGGDAMSRAAAAAEERKLSPEELAGIKADHMASFTAALDTDSMDASGMRTKIKELHEKLSKNVATTYDMEERHKVQEYDMRELMERQKQRLRQKAQRMGLDPEEAANAKHPPKKQVSSDYDRQTDRRSYSERKEVYKPKKEALPKVYHGSMRPPAEWGVTSKTEEVENMRKNPFERKYQEAEEAKVEGAKPPCPVVAAKEPSPAK